MELHPYEFKVLSALLKRSLQDSDKVFDIPSGVSEQECNEMLRRYHRWNENPEMKDPFDPDFAFVTDCELMAYFSDRLSEEERYYEIECETKREAQRTMEDIKNWIDSNLPLKCEDAHVTSLEKMVFVLGAFTKQQDEAFREEFYS